MDNKTKAKIYVLYYYQDVLRTSEGGKFRLFYDSLPEYKLDHTYLELTPLSQIPDKDAIEVAKIASQYSGRIEISERLNGGIVFLFPYVSEKIFFRFKSLSFYAVDFDKNTMETRSKYSIQRGLDYTDYLRSKGYALPAYGYSVDDLVKEGVFKLKP